MWKFLILGGLGYYLYTQDFIRAGDSQFMLGIAGFTVVMILFLLNNSNTKA